METLETTTCDRCGRTVSLTAKHVPDSPVFCKKCKVRRDAKIRRFLRNPARLEETEEPNPVDPSKRVIRKFGKRTAPRGYEPGMTGTAEVR